MVNLFRLIVEKGGANGDIHKVDGISGGTITSDGVSDMIDERFQNIYHILKVFQLKIKF